MVQVSPAGHFTYRPPEAARTARRILVKPNLGYPVGPPVTVSMAVLARVLDGLRATNPTAEVLIVEGACNRLPARQTADSLGLSELLNERTRFLDADELPCEPYLNPGGCVFKYAEVWAPTLLREVDCAISVGACKRTMLKGAVLMSCAVKNLFGLLPRSRYRARSPHSRGQLHRPDVHAVIADVYHCIGHHFHGAVVDATSKFISRDWEPDQGASRPLGKVIWGDELLEVDRRACHEAGEEPPAYLRLIDEARSVAPSR